MFNGIIYNTGKIKYIKKQNNYFLVGVESNLVLKKADIGSSISCNGVCLTITKLKNQIAFFYISKETLNRSNLSFLTLGNIINLEKSLIYGQRISGHFTHGHIDTTAAVKKISIVGKTWVIKFLLKNKSLSNFLVEKSSISINGISLTIASVNKDFFTINVIPHTLQLTNLKHLKIKNIVNVELDIFVKYIIKVSK